jgi:hypothetical protein
MPVQTRSRNKRRLLIAAGVLAIPALALAWWLGSPLFLDTAVDETFPPPGASSPSPDGSETAVPSSQPPDGTTRDTPGPSAAEPIQLLEGLFMDADAAHRGSGSATIFELEDGSRVLRFEEFEVTNGPDLHVLVVPTTGPIDRESLTAVGYEDLGELKGNIGNQNYELPADLDLDGSWTVVIYCVPFHVVFSTAQLSP